LSALGAAALALVTTSAEAATFTFEVFDVENLPGQTFSGSFNFDESLLTGVGEEIISGIDLEFSFLGKTFTEEDDVEFPSFPLALFFEFLRVIFWVSTSLLLALVLVFLGLTGRPLNIPLSRSPLLDRYLTQKSFHLRQKLLQQVLCLSWEG
jgi:hypothetical protein